tara:strand:- start:1768 stop:2559 length:792 start_codon:yes stop_codon:yes gene_type:complete
MDLIGKSYIDYLIESNKLDGSSHQLNEFTIGGVLNLLKDKQIKKIIEDNSIFNTILICNKKISQQLKENKNDLNINFYITNYDLPTAFIVEKNGSRSSFVINDKIIEVNNFIKKSSSACVFYADKIKSSIFKNYEKLYLDTAGNSLEDLYELAKNQQFPSETILSISSEFLKKDLLEMFLKNGFTIISHSPVLTKIHKKDSILEIHNDFYIDPMNMNKDNWVTGLGDKYLFFIALSNFYEKLTLEQSIRKSQEIISLRLRSMF